ncbi:MAG: UvrB/UvrC motif-containing protein [Phycisphaerae bacterium]|nr:UvrB/UvrC motif-containing protein [Phycisphaerae bacterium]
MKKKCDKCDKPATIHLTEIVNGQKMEKHLCEDCAEAEGITIKANIPISQLLEDFVLQTVGEEEETPSTPMTCEVCGMTFSEFRDKGQLGCPNDYEAFREQLLPILARAQDGNTQHVGKAPRRAGTAQQKQMAILRLRSQLKQAITAEQYERAADLRDQIKQVEAAEPERPAE